MYRPPFPTADDSDSVALVVPIHDAADQLTVCLDSIAAQTVFPSLQVVLVDDGSTDASADIAAAFAAAHENATLVVQDHQGVGAARNRGLREVRTPLVAFVDAVDCLPPGAVEALWAALAEHDADIAIGRRAGFSEGVPSGLAPQDSTTALVLGVEASPELIDGASAFNKLFRTAALEKLGLSFGVDTSFPDPYMVVPALLAADRVAVTPTVVYHYRQRAVEGAAADSLWLQPQRYLDQLALGEFLSGQRSGVPGCRRPILDQFLVRTFQGYALRAPEVLDPQELSAFFTRAVGLHRWTDPSVIRRACVDARHRVAFVAFWLEDWSLFSDRGAALLGVHAIEGRLQLRVDRDLPEVLQALLVADRISAHLESLDREDNGRTLRVRGRFSVDGLPLLAPLPCGLGLRVRGSAVTQQAANRRRHVASAKAVTDDWSGFECDIPAARLKDGDHQFRLVFDTPTGQASVYVRPANGALRGARTLPLNQRRVLLLKRGKAAVLRVQVGTGDEARRRWRKRLVREDLRHALARRPFWRERLIRLATLPFFRSDVWLLGERRDTAQDNSFALFRHLRQQRPDIRAYYVIDGDSEHADRVRPFGHMVAHSSWRHRLLTLHARVLVNSYDLDSYLLPDQWHTGSYLQHLAWRIGARRAFLQHGVTYNNVSAALHRGVTGLDLFVASSQREAEAVRAGMGFTTQVAVTGMPRFDNLNRSSVGRRILVMPTWRRNLVLPSYRKRPGARATEISPFETSTFATFWRGLLHDERLHAILERTDTTLEFFAHYEIAQVAGSLAPEHERIVISHHGTRGVQEAILDCSLFVTDWSSTFFDAAYAGRPLVMAPFDEVEFRRTQYAQGYFDFERDGFGPVVRTPDEAVEAITRCVEAGFVREESYEQRVDSFFDYRDAGQCERVVSAINRAIRGLPPVPVVLEADVDEDLFLVS